MIDDYTIEMDNGPNILCQSAEEHAELTAIIAANGRRLARIRMQTADTPVDGATVDGYMLLDPDGTCIAAGDLPTGEEGR